MEYEICYLIGEAKEADLEKIRKGVEEIITKYKGTLLEGEFVKKRRLAYEIEKEARGTYVAKRFTLPGKDERDEKYPGEDFISDMTKDLNFNQDILRFIIVKSDELLSFEELEAVDQETKREKEGFKKDAPARQERIVTPKKEAPAKKEEPKKEIEEAKEEAPAKKEKVEEKTEEVKEDAPVKEEEKEEDKKENKKDKKNDISEDNIDEKLDEILNI